MPRWWINWFYLMIAFGIGYLAWYGGLGGIDGLSGWTSHDEHALAKAADDARPEETFAPYKGRPIDEIARDPAENGRAKVCTPVTNAHPVCRLPLEKKNKDNEMSK